MSDLTNRHHDGDGAKATHAHDRRTQAHSPTHGIPTHPPVRSVAVWGPIVAVSLLTLFVVIGVWRRVAERREENAFTKQVTQLEVAVVNAQRDRKPKELTLPGTFQAFQET